MIRATNMQLKQHPGMKNGRAYLVGAAALAGAIVLSGCHVDMWIQPKAKAQYESEFFADRQGSRPLVPGTVSQNGSRLDDPAYYTAYGSDRKLVKTIPVRAVKSFASPKAMLERGREEYTVYCSPCHGASGNGNGMITQRGLGYWQKLPASYQTDRLRKIEDGHFYAVLTNGYGVMYGYASRIQNVDDRWAIVAYIRALQMAQQGVPESSLTPEQQKELRENSGGAEVRPTEGGDLPGNPNSVTQPTEQQGTEGVERPVNRTPGGAPPGAGSRIAPPGPAAGSSSATPAPPASTGTTRGSGANVAPGAGGR